MSRSGTKICGVCQTRFGNGTCIHMPGSGTTDDPFRPEPVIGDDGDTSENLAYCGPNGFGAVLPLIYRDPPACHLFSIFEQPVPYNAVWPVVYDDTRYDTDAMFDRDNNPSKIIFKTPGLYFITFNVQWLRTEESNATGGVDAAIRLNGADTIALDTFPTGDSFNYDKHSVSIYHPAVAGDYVESLVLQTVRDAADEPVNMTITPRRYSPLFCATYIRPLADLNAVGIPESAS